MFRRFLYMVSLRASLALLILVMGMSVRSFAQPGIGVQAHALRQWAATQFTTAANADEDLDQHKTVYTTTGTSLISVIKNTGGAASGRIGAPASFYTLCTTPFMLIADELQPFIAHTRNMIAGKHEKDALDKLVNSFNILSKESLMLKGRKSSGLNATVGSSTHVTYSLGLYGELFDNGLSFDENTVNNNAATTTTTTTTPTPNSDSKFINTAATAANTVVTKYTHFVSAVTGQYGLLGIKFGVAYNF